MRSKYFYLGVAAIGFVIPYSAYIPYVMKNGFRYADLWEKMLVNPIANFFAYDLALITLILIAFTIIEARRIGMKRVWIAILLMCAVGLAVGFPVFLFQRASHFEKK